MSMSANHRRAAGRITRNVLTVVAVTAIFGFKAAAPVSATPAPAAVDLAAR